MFLQDLQDLGYVESRDLQMTYRSSDGYQDRLPALAEGLVRLNPDVLVAAGLDAVVALRNVTQTIPIVSATLADAVHLGLIANEARPTALSDPKSGQTLVYVYFEVSPAGDRRRNCLMRHEGIAASCWSVGSCDDDVLPSFRRRWIAIHPDRSRRVSRVSN